MTLRSLGLAATLGSALCAQGPKFVSTLKPLFDLRATQVPRLLEQWPASKLGRLFADEDARFAGELAVKFQAGRIARQTALRLALQQLPSTEDAPPHVIASLYMMQPNEIWRLFERPVEEVESVEFTSLLPSDGEELVTPHFVRTMSCQPRYEGRWQQRFDAEAQERARSTMFRPVADAKISSFPVHAFALPVGAADVGFGDLPRQHWMLHLPGRFAYGNGVPAEVGRVDAGPARPEAEVCLETHFDHYNQTFRDMGVGVPAELALLGVEDAARALLQQTALAVRCSMCS